MFPMIYGLLFARTAIPWSLRHATVWICRATHSFIIDIDLWGDVSFFFPCFFQEWDTSSNCRSFAGRFGHRAWHESHGDRLGTDRPWWPCFRAHMFFYSTSNRAKMPLKYGEFIDRGKGNDNEWHFSLKLSTECCWGDILMVMSAADYDDDVDLSSALMHCPHGLGEIRWNSATVDGGLAVLIGHLHSFAIVCPLRPLFSIVEACLRGVDYGEIFVKEMLEYVAELVGIPANIHVMQWIKKNLWTASNS